MPVWGRWIEVLMQNPTVPPVKEGQSKEMCFIQLQRVSLDLLFCRISCCLCLVCILLKEPDPCGSVSAPDFELICIFSEVISLYFHLTGPHRPVCCMWCVFLCRWWHAEPVFPVYWDSLASLIVPVTDTKPAAFKLDRFMWSCVHSGLKAGFDTRWQGKQ